MTNQSFEITVNVTRTGDTPRTRSMTEREFRRNLAGILVQASEFGGGEFESLARAAELIEAVGPDSSWLGTFTTLAEQSLDQAVPDGCECPRCAEYLMDHIMPQDNGDFLCDCGATYSGDTSSGRPAWWEVNGQRRYFVPARNLYVSIPD